MKFLIDAQLPKSLRDLFIARGFDCIHTSDLKLGNDTTGKSINEISIKEKRIAITKDSDFFKAFLRKITF